jgi:hypothetical protein
MNTVMIARLRSGSVPVHFPRMAKTGRVAHSAQRLLSFDLQRVVVGSLVLLVRG